MIKENSDIARGSVDIDGIEEMMLKLPQAKIKTEELFAPGVMLKIMYAPAGSVVMGHEHKTKHFNIVLKGRVKILVGEDQVIGLEAPDIFVSEPGSRKLVQAVDDLVWVNIHPTTETDMKKIEDSLIIKSDAYLKHHRQLEEKA